MSSAATSARRAGAPPRHAAGANTNAVPAMTKALAYDTHGVSAASSPHHNSADGAMVRAARQARPTRHTAASRSRLKCFTRQASAISFSEAATKHRQRRAPRRQAERRRQTREGEQREETGDERHGAQRQLALTAGDDRQLLQQQEAGGDGSCQSSGRAAPPADVRTSRATNASS